MREHLAWQGWREWLASNHRGWRLIVGAVCALGLALFLHFREVRLDIFELNALAGRYVVAQVDFEFPDYETTIVLKQQAMPTPRSRVGAYASLSTKLTIDKFERPGPILKSI